MTARSRDYRVFKRAAWHSMTPVQKATIWPILVVVLPILWELFVAWLNSRDERTGTLETIDQFRRAGLNLDPKYHRAIRKAEREIPLD